MHVAVLAGRYAALEKMVPIVNFIADLPITTVEVRYIFLGL